jgi:adenylate cyclase class 2
MATETEAKFYIHDLPALQQRVEALGASRVDTHVHELNLRFDTPNRDLHRLGRVLRLRQDSRARMTYKDSETPHPGTLSRREVEFTVSDFDAARELLLALGYQIAFTYEKYRTTYKLGTLEIVLDELPYGHFVEIEGDGPIQETAEKLGLRWSTVIRESYSLLFEQLQNKLHLGFRDLTFENFKAKQVTPDELGVAPADR